MKYQGTITRGDKRWIFEQTGVDGIKLVVGELETKVQEELLRSPYATATHISFPFVPLEEQLPEEDREKVAYFVRCVGFWYFELGGDGFDFNFPWEVGESVPGVEY